MKSCHVHRPVPAWRQLLSSPDFQLIAAVNAVIFTTNNGGRSVLMPLLAKEHLAMKTSTLGAQGFNTADTHHAAFVHANNSAMGSGMHRAAHILLIYLDSRAIAHDAYAHGGGYVWAPHIPAHLAIIHSETFLLPVGFVFAGMAVVSFLVILPASRVSDRLGRKWTIVPSAVAMATALLLMAAAGAASSRTSHALSCQDDGPHGCSCPLLWLDEWLVNLQRLRWGDAVNAAL